MADGYKNAGEHEFADLDEWLCEYVDGTIDPVVCQALEEYMQHNEELASHVERLREARHLLCQYGCSYQAPSGLQPRLRRRLATEIIQESEPFLGGSTIHLMTLATLTSFVALFLIFASTSESTISSNPPVTAEQTSSKEKSLVLAPGTAPSRPLLAPYQRATPVLSLAKSKHYSRFIDRESVRHRHLTPRLYPLSAFTERATGSPQPAKVYFTP